MIPTYRPSPAYLRETLEAVLLQDPGPEEMQLEVIDDCSPDGDVTALVRSIAGNRVAVTRSVLNRGLAGSWNYCVEHAHGEWIHILHQDDLIFPGFYTELRKVIADFPSVGAAFCRHCFLDEQSAWVCLSPIEGYRRTLLSDWQFLLTAGTRIQCPSIVVRRSVYVALGGFRRDIPYCLDWEMWARIAAVYPFGYSPAILAGHRSHPGSETSRLTKDATGIQDQMRTFQLLEQRLPPDRRDAARLAFTSYILPLLLQQAVGCYVNGRFGSAIEMIASVSGLPFPRRERRELGRIVRNSRIKRWLSAAGLLRQSQDRTQSVIV